LFCLLFEIIQIAMAAVFGDGEYAG
jgi:hypothetical protein